jgi:hypothetical protein
MIPDAVGKKLIGLVTSKDEIADLLTVRMQFEYSYDDCANKNVKNSAYDRPHGIIIRSLLTQAEKIPRIPHPPIRIHLYTGVRYRRERPMDGP